MADVLGIGIIGFGRIGAEHAAWIAAAGGGGGGGGGRDSARVACVADPTGARRERARAAGLDVVADVEELLRRDDVSAVLVASPPSMHFDHAVAALQAGRHVIVEKPMTLDYPTARRLAEEAERRGRVISVFHNRRWDVDFLTLSAAVAAGTFGRVINVESRLGQWASCVGPAAREYRPNWRNEKSFGGGGLFDWGSHFVDQAWRLLRPDRPTHVFAQLRGNVWSGDCDDFARVCLNFASGATALVEINTTTTRPLPRWHVDGTAGSADSPASASFDTRAWAQFTFTAADGATHPLPTAAPGLTEVEIWQQFAAACRGIGRPAVEVASVLPTMALLDAARQSSESGQSVALPPQLFD